MNVNIEDEVEVSVCLVTYNQEDYIAECIESIVNQITNFRFELIIGEDCSTDNTRSIIMEYAKKFPKLIVPVFHESNIGGSKNVISVYNKACGKYISHIDGDDYFLPGKLQLQKDYMDENPNMIISFHRSIIEFPNNSLVEDNYDINNNPIKYSLKELILLGAIGTNSSKMFLTKNHQIFIDFSKNIDISVIDYLYNVIILSEGYVGYLPNEPLVVYRRDIGISTINPNLSDRHYKSYDIISNYYNNEYDKYIGATSFISFLADIKNKRNFRKSLLYMKKYTDFKSVYIVLKYAKIIKSLNWPKS